MRPRVQIPGPRPFLYLKSAISLVVGVSFIPPYHNFLQTNQTGAV